MSIAAVLTSNAGLSVVATLLGGLWTWFKSSDWYRRRQEGKFRRALEILEAAVEETYRNYVQQLKTNSDSGKLSLAERSQARQMARERAFVLAEEEGVNLEKDLGSTKMDLWISKLVKKLKR